MRYRFRKASFAPENEGFVHASSDTVNLVKRRDVTLRRFGHWSTEAYGLGSLYRGLLRWPQWRALPFTSEHGIPFGTSSAKYALEGWSRLSRDRLHLTWNREVEATCPQFGVPVIRIPHPWAVGWRANGWNPSVKWDGPLLIVPHSLPDVRSNDPVNYWNHFLASLNAEVRPSAALLSFHDLGGEVEDVLHANKIPVYCVGRATSDFFFERFFHIVSQFPFVIGPNISSASFYVEDFGVPFLRVAEELVFDYSVHKSKLGTWSHQLHNRSEFHEAAVEYFSLPIERRRGSPNDGLVERELSLDLLEFDFAALGGRLRRSNRKNLFSD